MIPLGPTPGRFALARDRLGRAATVAGATALVTGAFVPDLYSASMIGAAAASAYGVVWSATAPRGGGAREAAAALSLSPSLSAAALLTTERLIGGFHWWELAADLAWTVATWCVRPARLARTLAAREPSLAPAGEVVDPGQHPMATWWAARVGCEGGAAPGTALVDVERTGPRSITAIIRTTSPGVAVPAISTTALSALLDWPEEEITVVPVPGRGAGVRRLTVGQAPVSEADLASLWATQIAPKGMPNTVITAVRTVETAPEVRAS